MKKYLSVLLASTVALGAVSCGSSETPSNDAASGDNTSQVATGDEATTNDEVITLTYLDWGVGPEGDDNVQRAMVASYEETHPNVNIEILAVPEGDNFNNYISTLAASNQMPDVFTWANVSDTIIRDWAYDATDLVQNDSDYASTQDSIRLGGQFEGRTFGLPTAMNYMGMYINKTLFDKNNVPYLEFGYSMDDLLTAIEKNSTSTSKGVDNFAVHQWYPLTQNPDYGFATCDGIATHFDSPEFAEGVAISQEVTSNNWDMKNTTALEFFGEDGWAWGDIAGIASQYDGSWIIKDLTKNGKFEFDYVGLPGGYTVVANDYLFIGASTKNPEAAYDFAKYMSFGEEGIDTRLTLASLNDKYVLAYVPPTTNPELTEKILPLYDNLPGFKKAYETYLTQPELLVVEGYKEVPGFAKAIYDADTGVQGKDAEGNAISYTQAQLVDQIVKGNEKLADHARRLTDIANAELANARTETEAKLNK